MARIRLSGGIDLSTTISIISIVLDVATELLKGGSNLCFCSISLADNSCDPAAKKRSALRGNTYSLSTSEYPMIAVGRGELGI